MPYANADDGVRLYYEEHGSGRCMIFVHEFADDLRGWDLQLRHFEKKYRCIVYNARGYEPSDVPENVESYSQSRAAADIKAVLDHAGERQAHVVGLSMGGFATLHFGLDYPDRAYSICVGGCGYGAEPSTRAGFQKEAENVAQLIRKSGMEVFAERYGKGPSRVQFANKDPDGFAEFTKRLASHSALGSMNTQLGVQRQRPSIYDLEEAMLRLRVPTLLLTGDEDWPCLAPSIFMKRTISSSALYVFPNSGHAINLEEPEDYNRVVDDFVSRVDAGGWPLRDPRAVGATATGITDED